MSKFDRAAADNFIDHAQKHLQWLGGRIVALTIESDTFNGDERAIRQTIEELRALIAHALDSNT